MTMPRAVQTPTTLIPTARRVPPAPPAATEHTLSRRAPRRRFLMEAGATIALSLGATAAVLAPDPTWGAPAAEDAGPDAELLRLGRELTACHEAKARAWLAVEDVRDTVLDEDPVWQAAEAAADRVRAVIAQIEACTATTLPGVLVKARALAWCRSNDPATVETFPATWVEWFGAQLKNVGLELGELHAFLGKPGGAA